MATKDSDNIIDDIVNDISELPIQPQDGNPIKSSKSTSKNQSKKDGAKASASKKSPKHPSPKNIDGFKQPHKKSPASFATEDSVPISVEDTTVTIIEADDIEPSADESSDANAEPASPEEIADERLGTDNVTFKEPVAEEDDITIIEVDEDGTAKSDDTAEDNAPEDDATEEDTVEEDIAIESSTTETDEPEESEESEDSEEIEDDEVEEVEEIEETEEVEETEKSEDEDIEKLLDDFSASKPKSTKSATTPKSSLKSQRTAPNGYVYRIISRILGIITTIILGTFVTYASLSNAIPFKYVTLIIGISAIFSGFYIFKTFRRKTHLSVLTVLNIFGVIISIASLFGFLKFNELLNFLDNNLGSSNTSYSIYNVIVSKESSYNSLDDVKGKEFHSISDFVDTTKLESAVKEQADGTVVYVKDITSMLKDTAADLTYISLLNSGTYDATVDTTDGKVFKDTLKVIGEIKVAAEKETLSSNTDVTKESWLLYISGIDTRSGQMLDRSLSDVNIVMAINPKTKNILMVAIPRDYYVQLHGTTGLPDKLTHAGSLGGLSLSMSTIEDILGVDIQQYLRVNFNAVTGLVNAIGGITVNSDVDYSFKCYTNPNCTINPGLNNLDGDCALAFARERMAYSSGDRHRGENQEQVIEKVFDKITSSATLISKYSDILRALSGSFETSLTTSDITSLVNMQLDDMAKWTIESYNLNGTTSGAYTYSYPNQTLSVMFPDAATIETAKAKIQAVLSGNKASSVSVLSTNLAASF
ncbi:LCP family protein [Candidatus Saccharibacteria bacterium]|nr:LCP family protein [Candidatus Saccharibacteria bacterium]